MVLYVDRSPGSALRRNFDRFRGSDQRGLCLTVYVMPVWCFYVPPLWSLLRLEAIAKDCNCCFVFQFNYSIAGTNGIQWGRLGIAHEKVFTRMLYEANYTARLIVPRSFKEGLFASRVYGGSLCLISLVNEARRAFFSTKLGPALVTRIKKNMLLHPVGTWHRQTFVISTSN